MPGFQLVAAGRSGFAKAVRLAACCGFGLVATTAVAQEKIVVAVPGVPPVWAGVVNFVAKERGFYAKHGLDATVRPFNAVDQSVRAVVTGEVATALIPTPVLINVVSNSDADVVAISGLENPDWLVGSTSAAKTDCRDLRGQGVAVDAVAGIRGIVLRQILRSCDLTMEDVSPVAMGSTAGSALVSGQIHFGILHIDDVPVIERMTGKKVHVVKTLRQVNPNTHYLSLVTKRSTLSAKRDVFTRLLAAHIEATEYMRNPKNADEVARIAKVTGRDQAEALDALRAYNEMEFWPVRHDALNRSKITGDIAVQTAVGGIAKGKTPTTYERITDRTVFADALGLVK